VQRRLLLLKHRKQTELIFLPFPGTLTLYQFMWS
jgi:hypothetical protein